jgi:hypothetical protein
MRKAPAMKMRGRICCILTCLSVFLLAHPPVYGESTGAAFLKISPGARAAGMSSAFTAIADDASAVYWNPSGIANIPRSQFMFTHSQWLEGMSYDYASFVQPRPKGAVGLGVTWLSQGSFDGRDENRQPTGSFSASDFALAASMSRRLSWGSIGMNLKVINQKIESESATGIAVDFGYKYQYIGLPLSVGLAVQNIGPQMKFIDEAYSLPLTISGGVGYRIGGMVLAVDISQGVYSNNTSMSIGTEYWIYNAVALRTGYLSRVMSFSKTNSDINGDLGSKLENIAGLGAGIGLKIANYQVDYALVPYGELGNTQRITLSAGF